MATKDPAPAPPRDQTGLVAAFQSVTDGVTDLALTHLELAKAEARRDAKVYLKDVGVAAVGVGLGLLGVGLINLAIVCLAGYFGGLAAMAATAAVFGILYAVIGRSVSRDAIRRMKERDSALSTTKDEFKRSTKWAKQIKTESS